MLSYFRLLYHMVNPRSIIIRRISWALGDNIMLTILPEILAKKHKGCPIIVETPYPELFFNNPNVTWATNRHISTIKKTIKPVYKISSANDLPARKQMAAYAGETETPNPVLYLSESETEWARKLLPFEYVVVAPVGKAKHSANRKDWGFSNFQAVVNALPHIRFVQIGTPREPLLENVTDCRMMDIRKTAAIMKNSRMLLGLEGGFMHLAASVNVPAVIVLGGHIHISATSYKSHVVITSTPECSPCFSSSNKSTECDHMKCMNSIVPEKVIEKILNLLTKAS